MTYSSREQAFKAMNELGQAKVPFLFIIDFEMNMPIVVPIEDLPQHDILFDINGYRNFSFQGEKPEEVKITKLPISYEAYLPSYKIVKENLNYGNSFLVNLTRKTEITLDQSLKAVFYQSKAKYKLLLNNQFLVFSPEIFVKIKKGIISSYPMKGTIDKSVPEAEAKILNDPKEMAEHVTIVDLIRNDLSRVANKVEVKKFRYIDEIKTQDKTLLQVSSQITGELLPDNQLLIGEILSQLLPAGSVSGAPKAKTMEIIKSSEREDRGYFTGVFGYFNGRDLDSGVMIRYIEKTNGKYYFRSGGGITVNSQPQSEYREMIDKVYVPVN